MKKMKIEQMGIIEGGSVIANVAGASCGAAVSGVFFGGFGLVVSALIFGPTCIATGAAYLFS